MKLRDGKVIGEESKEEELIFSLVEFFNLATCREIVLNYFNMTSKSLKELAAPTFDDQPLHIVFPEITALNYIWDLFNYYMYFVVYPMKILIVIRKNFMLFVVQ